jgi:hypothetical protein
MPISIPKLAAATATLAVALVPAAASAGPSASASKACTAKRSGVTYAITGRKHLSCSKAKAAFKAYSPSHTHGYTCSPKAVGVFGTCHKGQKRFTYSASQQQGKR